MRISVCFRLGIKIYEKHPCKCGEAVDELGHHPFSCKRNYGKTIRHNLVNNILNKSLTAAGIQNRLEPSYLSSTNGLRPDGITLLPFHRGRALVWDVTLPHPLTTTHLKNFTPAETARVAEAQKNTKYEEFRRSYHFMPVAIETTGGYGPQATQLIKSISKSLIDKTGDVRAGTFFRQRISLGVQRGNAKTILFSLS